MRLLLTLMLWLPTLAANAQSGPRFDFVPNQHQWPAQVRFSTALPGGRLFFEDTRFTYSLVAGDLEHPKPGQPLKGHAFRMQLVGAQPQPAISGEEAGPGYHNYFLGNEPQHWASQVPTYQQLSYRQVYPGVDMRWHSQASQLEYDFIVAPGASPATIRMRYEGLDKVTIYNGQLQLHTSLGVQTEQAPVAYQLRADGQHEPVACRFRLRGAAEVGFEVTGAYDRQRPLIIDPTLIFCTYSGTTGGMSANCAASDAAGNVYTAGLVIGTPYPVTVGAFQPSGIIGNMGISKYSPDGRTLLYSTYLGGTVSFGGSYSEYPLKLVVNSAGELSVLGVTNSTNFPVTASAYQRQNRGNQDMSLTRFSASGSTLLGSTYLGGTGKEGGDLSSIPAAMTTDASGNLIVGCSTASSDFPVLNGVQGNAPSTGGFYTDGFITKLNPTLTAVLWSTYLGGLANDQVHDIRIAPNGSLYICGQTDSPNFPTSATALKRVAAGGLDGFVTNLSATGNTLLASTYLGTTATESARFLDFDSQGRVCVGGETNGSYPVTAGTYSFPGSGFVQAIFIHCLSSTLSSTAFSTRIATNTDTSFGSSINGLTAFALTDCDQIMFSAYAGQGINTPTTTDAFSRSYRSIYLCSLNPSALSMSYGSYFGSAQQFSTHLHAAAASQITRTGILTHIECSTASDYPTSPGVIGRVKQGFTNDGAIFKFSVNGALISDFRASFPAVAPACAPYTVQFDNTSVGAKTYRWLFGDGSPVDTARKPTHVFAAAGTYQVQLVISRPSTNCGPTLDTARTTLTVKAVPPNVTRTLSLDCNANLTLDAGVDAPSYEWSTGERTRTIQRVNQPGHYIVRILDPASCPYQIDFNVIRGGTAPTDLQRTALLKCSEDLTLDAGTEATSYQWSTGERTRVTRPITQPGHYVVRIVDLSGCSYQIDYEVTRDVPVLKLANIITPNNDGANDELRLPAALAGSGIKIFSRWGRLVYQSAQYANNWQGETLPAGVYYYEVSPTSTCSGVLKGWVEIVR